MVEALGTIIFCFNKVMFFGGRANDVIPNFWPTTTVVVACSEVNLMCVVVEIFYVKLHCGMNEGFCIFLRVAGERRARHSQPLGSLLNVIKQNFSIMQKYFICTF